MVEEVEIEVVTVDQIETMDTIKDIMDNEADMDTVVIEEVTAVVVVDTIEEVDNIETISGHESSTFITLKYFVRAKIRIAFT